MNKLFKDLTLDKSRKNLLTKSGKKIKKIMKILSVVILLLSVVHPDWMTNNFFGSAVDQSRSTSLTVSHQFSYKVVITSDTTIVAATGFQIVNFSDKGTSGKDKMFDFTRLENRESVVLKGLMENGYTKNNCAFYLLGNKDHLDLNSYYKLNDNRSWTIWRDFKDRDIDESELPGLTGYNYLVDDRREFCKYYRPYLVNTVERFICGCNFHLSDELGNIFTDFFSYQGRKLEKHILICKFLFNRGSGKLYKNYIYTTGNKGMQINADKEAFLLNEASQGKLKYLYCLGEHKKSNERSDQSSSEVIDLLWQASLANNIYKEHLKDYQLLTENAQNKYKDESAWYITSLNEDIKNTQIIPDPLVQILKLQFIYTTPKKSYSTPWRCYAKYRDRNNSKSMQEYLAECFYKSNKPKHIMMLS